jgi:hypothetical protein
MSELGKETDALLRHGREGDSLNREDQARLKRVLVAQIAAASVVATTTTAAAWTAVATKVVGGIVIVGVVAAGVAAVAPKHAPQSTSHTRPPVTTTSPLPAPLPAPAPAPERPAPPTSEPAVPSTSPPRVAPLSPPSPPVPPAEAPPTALPTSLPSTLEEETRLLHEADDAMRSGDAQRALRVLDTSAARYPNSSLAPERAAERVFALCMAGQKDEAREAAAKFLGVQSVGPLANRVRASCGGNGR